MNRIITIGREFGSGGRELGYRIAEKLQIAYYDQEIIPVRIFAYADMESRIKRCMERRPEDENLTEAQMKKRITEIDRNRAKYYAFFSGQKWGARENYDLLVNTSGADIKELSSALCGYLETLFE